MTGSIKLSFLNARSIKTVKSGSNEFFSLKTMIECNEPDLMLINEMWLNKTVLDTELFLNGYDMFRKDRLVGRGGGIIFYFKTELLYVIED